MSDDRADDHGSTRIGRRRTVLIAGGIAGLLALVAGLAIVAKPSGSSPSARAGRPTPGTLRIVARLPVTATSTLAPTPTPTAIPTAIPATEAASPLVTSVRTTAPAVPTPAPPASPNPTTLPTPAPTDPPVIFILPAVTATLPPPPSFGPKVLEWTAPAGLDVGAGQTATLAVTAHNPTAGIVTLPHPLSCVPRLDHGEMCAGTVQLIAAGRSASAKYTIDAHGVAPGSYTLDIEGVLTVTVTVT